MGLRVLIGKGTPSEIVKETLIYEKLRGVDLANMSKQEIRKFMVKRHIGIDCSGFVVHVLTAWLKGNKKKALWKYLRFPDNSLYRRIARFLRPVENISTQMLTEDLNSEQVKNLDEIRPGDLIRSRLQARSKKLKRGYHVLLITEVEKESGKTRQFTYAHSSRRYADKHGVRTGEVVVSDPLAPLCDQEWKEEYKGRNWTHDEICLDSEYSQVRRMVHVPLHNEKE